MYVYILFDLLLLSGHHVCFVVVRFVLFCFVSQALQLKPNYPKVLLRKARLHKRLSQWNLAIKVRVLVVLAAAPAFCLSLVYDQHSRVSTEGDAEAINCVGWESNSK